jgi:hypothetical protein
MLLDTIQRLQAKSISLVSIDALRASGKRVPPQIHSVPALMIMPSKQIIFGKQVFDYLLLPGKGLLTSGIGKPQQQQGFSKQQSQQDIPQEPQAFTMNITNSSSDNFAFIEDDTANSHRNYTWTHLDEQQNTTNTQNVSINTETTTLQTGTRIKKEVLDIEEFKAKRAEDLNLVVNPNVSDPPITTY